MAFIKVFRILLGKFLLPLHFCREAALGNDSVLYFMFFINPVKIIHMKDTDVNTHIPKKV